MKRILLIVIAILLMAAGAIGCGGTGTVTVTEAETTLTQFLTTVTVTEAGEPIIVTLPASTVTLPAITTIHETTTTVTQPVTVTDTVTQPPVTTTTTVTSPPVTTIVTITPTTPPTAAQVINVTIGQFFGSGAITLPESSDVQEFILALNYDNTANVDFSGVKFAVTFLTQGVTVAAPATDILLASYGGNPIWFLSNAASPYIFQTYTGVNIAAGAEGVIYLTFQIKYTGSGFAAPQVYIIN